MTAPFTITLEAARVNRGYTQETFAKALGVHRNTVVNWERGATRPNRPMRKKIAELSGIPFEYLSAPEPVE